MVAHVTSWQGTEVNMDYRKRPSFKKPKANNNTELELMLWLSGGELGSHQKTNDTSSWADR